MTAMAAVRAVHVQPGDTVSCPGPAAVWGRSRCRPPAGGAGARHRQPLPGGVAAGARREPVPHSDALKERLLAATGGRIGALIDTFGQGYEAPAVDLGVPAARIDTVIDFAAAAESGVTPEANAVGG